MIGCQMKAHSPSPSLELFVSFGTYSIRKSVRAQVMSMVDEKAPLLGFFDTCQPPFERIGNRLVHGSDLEINIERGKSIDLQSGASSSNSANIEIAGLMPFEPATVFSPRISGSVRASDPNYTGHCPGLARILVARLVL